MSLAMKNENIFCEYINPTTKKVTKGKKVQKNMSCLDME